MCHWIAQQGEPHTRCQSNLRCGDCPKRAGNQIVAGISIEMAFANKNVSSNNSTQQVIGLAHLAAHQLQLPITEFTPQAIKRCCGLGGRATKDEMLRTATALFGKQFDKKDNHLVDAAFAGIAGIREFRKKGRITRA